MTFIELSPLAGRAVFPCRTVRSLVTATRGSAPRNPGAYNQGRVVISVILTTYERRGLLARALASVHAQTLTDHEVIVVDDGSTDGTAEFLGTQPVRSIRIAHSGNPAVVRNAGLTPARGDFITFLDSDDVWQPTALTELAEALSQHPDAGF